MKLTFLASTFYSFSFSFPQPQTASPRWRQVEPLQTPQRPAQQRAGQAHQPAALHWGGQVSAGQAVGAAPQRRIPEGQELLQWWVLGVGGLSPIAQRVTGNYVRTQRSDLIFQFRLLPTMLLFPVFKGAIQTIFFSVPLCVLVAASHDFLVMGLRFGKVLQTSLEKRKYAVE